MATGTCSGKTLGGNADTAPLREYAMQVFGVDFPPDAVVTENRLSDAEFLGSSPIEHLLQPREDFSEVLEATR